MEGNLDSGLLTMCDYGFTFLPVNFSLYILLPSFPLKFFIYESHDRQNQGCFAIRAYCSLEIPYFSQTCRMKLFNLVSILLQHF